MTTGLSEDKEKDWRTKYACVDDWISEAIFSEQTQRVLDMGKAITDFAVTLGVSPEQAKKIYELFEEMGKMTLEQLRGRLRAVTMKTHREQMRGIAERVASEKIKQYLPND